MKAEVRSVAVLGVVVVLAGCSTPQPPPPDPQIKQFAEGAGAAYQRGEVERADALYAKALQRARLSDNRLEISRNAYNLAVCRMTEGKLDEARGLLDQAGALAEQKGPGAARILLAKSEVARLARMPADSEQLARQAEAVGADHEGKVQARLLQGEAALASGQSQIALEHYRRSKSGVSKQTPASIRARLEGLGVCLIQSGVLSGDIGAARLRLADWLRKAGQFKEMVTALEDAANYFEQSGKFTDAFDCRIRMAQSLLAAGNRDAALAAARKASEWAERGGQAGQKALAAGLIKELN